MKEIINVKRLFREEVGFGRNSQFRSAWALIRECMIQSTPTIKLVLKYLEREGMKDRFKYG